MQSIEIRCNNVLESLKDTYAKLEALLLQNTSLPATNPEIFVAIKPCFEKSMDSVRNIQSGMYQAEPLFEDGVLQIEENHAKSMKLSYEHFAKSISQVSPGKDPMFQLIQMLQSTNL